MSTVRHHTDLPPSLRTTATGTAAWARTVLLWWPLSLLVGVEMFALATGGGPSSADLVASVAGVASAIAMFSLLTGAEIRRTAKQAISPLAAGWLLATAGAGAGALIVVFLITGLVA